MKKQTNKYYSQTSGGGRERVWGSEKENGPGEQRTIKYKTIQQQYNGAGGQRTTELGDNEQYNTKQHNNNTTGLGDNGQRNWGTTDNTLQNNTTIIERSWGTSGNTIQNNTTTIQRALWDTGPEGQRMDPEAIISSTRYIHTNGYNYFNTFTVLLVVLVTTIHDYGIHSLITVTKRQFLMQIKSIECKARSMYPCTTDNHTKVHDRPT